MLELVRLCGAMCPEKVERLRQRDGYTEDKDVRRIRTRPYAGALPPPSGIEAVKVGTLTGDVQGEREPSLRMMVTEVLTGRGTHHRTRAGRITRRVWSISAGDEASSNSAWTDGYLVEARTGPRSPSDQSAVRTDQCPEGTARRLVSNTHKDREGIARAERREVTLGRYRLVQNACHLVMRCLLETETADQRSAMSTVKGERERRIGHTNNCVRGKRRTERRLNFDIQFCMGRRTYPHGRGPGLSCMIGVDHENGMERNLSTNQVDEDLGVAKRASAYGNMRNRRERDA